MRLKAVREKSYWELQLTMTLKLASHVENLCKNVSRKIHDALARIRPYTSLTKKRSLLNALFVSQFSYCPLAWMCHSRTLNKLHERCPLVIYNYKKSTFQKSIDKNKSLLIHNQNLKVLATEMHKVKKGLSPQVFALSRPETSLIIIYVILLVLRRL